MKILGFDIGITSIGWCLAEINNDNFEIIKTGVRIFTKAENPKTGASLALPRRTARGSRRRLNRRRVRLNALKSLLCKEFGFERSIFEMDDCHLPDIYKTNQSTKNPWILRVEALDLKLNEKEFARVLLHIAKHRGYGNKHAIKSESQSDQYKKEQQKVLSAISNNQEKMRKFLYRSGAEMLVKENYMVSIENRKYKNLRNRKAKSTTQNKAKETNYANSLPQTMTKKEMGLIFEKQREFGLKFSDKFRQEFIQIAFFQRPLKDFSNLVGKCKFYKEEKRAAKNSPSAEEFVALTKIINELHHIEKISGEIYDKKAVVEEIFTHAKQTKKGVTFTAVRKILKLPDEIKFYHTNKTKDSPEKDVLIELKGYHELKNALGNEFKNKTQKQLDEIARCVALYKDEDSLSKNLPNLNKDCIRNLAQISFSKFINLSFKALYEILPLMREGLKYDEACEKLDLKLWQRVKRGKFLEAICNTDFADDLTNPVLKRAISQYRKVLNSIIKEYGSVHKIHFELAREVKKSFQDRQALIKQQNNNRALNDEAKTQCENIGLPINTTNILKMKLWLEQKEQCVYSARKISSSDILSNLVEVDHIYPYSRSFDDSQSNKVLVFQKENQYKGDKTPYEAFGKDENKWGTIEKIAKTLSKAKCNKLLDTTFKNQDMGDVEKDFKDRNLSDTGYISRFIMNYTKDSLEFLPFDDQRQKHVLSVKGALTSILRHYWGFDKKERISHIHHAVDACIIAFSTEKTIKAFAEVKKIEEQLKSNFYKKMIKKDDFIDKLNSLKAKFEPFYGFRKAVLNSTHEIFVSRPPRKRVRGQLHGETVRSEKKCLLNMAVRKDLKEP